MSLQKNFDVFIIGELEIRRFDFFFFPLKNILELSLGLQLELVAFLGQLPCCRPPCSLPFSSQFFSFFFFGVCVISCFVLDLLLSSPLPNGETDANRWENFYSRSVVTLTLLTLLVWLNLPNWLKCLNKQNISKIFLPMQPGVTSFIQNWMSLQVLQLIHNSWDETQSRIFLKHSLDNGWRKGESDHPPWGSIDCGCHISLPLRGCWDLHLS